MTYVTDLRHFLDDDGEIVANMPSEARQLASFLALIVDEANGFVPSIAEELTIRCRSEGCSAQILAHRESNCSATIAFPVRKTNCR